MRGSVTRVGIVVLYNAIGRDNGSVFPIRVNFLMENDLRK